MRSFPKVQCIVFDNQYINVSLEVKNIANLIISLFRFRRLVMLTSIFSFLLCDAALTGRLISIKYAAFCKRENIAKFTIYEKGAVLSTPLLPPYP